MKKGLRRIQFCLLIAAVIWTTGILSGRANLNEMVPRFYMITMSENGQDQQMKHQGYNAALDEIRKDLNTISSSDAAYAYLQENLPKIEKIIKETIRSAEGSKLLTNATKGKNGYQFHCFLSDVLGKWENILKENGIIPCSLDGNCAIM